MSSVTTTAEPDDASPEVLTAEDLEILALEADNVVGHTCKVVVLQRADFQQTISTADVRKHVAARAVRVPRLARRLGRDVQGRPAWIADRTFDIANHIGRVADEGPLRPDDIPSVVGSLMARPLPRDRPLWRLDVIERVDDDTSVLVWRLHHALADGYTAMRLADAVLWDDGPQSAESTTHLDRTGPVRRAGAHPVRWWKSLTATARLYARIPGAVRRELVTHHTSTVFDVAPSHARSVAFVVIPLDALERVAKANRAHVTINDVLLAVITGAMRTWLRQRGAALRGIRAKIPVGLHSSEAHADEVANRDSYFFLDLPLGEPDAVQRLLKVSRATRDRKRHRDAETIYRMPFSRRAAHWARSRRVFTFNVSNVRGPTRRLSVMNAPVTALHSIAEIGAHHAIRFAALSSSGQISISICADSADITDIGALQDAMYGAVRELVAS